MRLVAGRELPFRGMSRRWSTSNEMPSEQEISRPRSRWPPALKDSSAIDLLGQLRAANSDLDGVRRESGQRGFDPLQPGVDLGQLGLSSVHVLLREVAG